MITRCRVDDTSQFARVYFTDVILFTVRLLVVPAPSTVADAEMTLVAMETLSSIIWRAGHMNASGTAFPTPLTSANVSARPPFGSGKDAPRFKPNSITLFGSNQLRTSSEPASNQLRTSSEPC